MKRPLGLVAFGYGTGLLLGELLHPPLPLLLAISLGLAAGATSARRWRGVLIWPLIVFTGWTNLVWHTAVVSPYDLRVTLTSSPEQVTLCGVLSHSPTERIHRRAKKETVRTLARLRVTALQRGATWQRAFGQIVVTTPGKLPAEFFGGQEVQVSGVIAPPRQPLAEGLFDYRAYLRRQGIHYQLKAYSVADWRLVSSGRVPPMSDRFRAWARAVLERGLPAEDEPLHLLWAMTLGWKSTLAKDATEPFIRSGTRHIFAISGLHIALITGILVSLLRTIQLPRAACGLTVIPLIWLYTAATGWQPSAVRSTVMMSIIVAGWSLRRPSDLLNSLAAAALIILLWDPNQLFQAGFQLSFLVVLSIALLLPPLERVRDCLLRSDPLLPPDLVPRWQRWLGAPLRYLTTCLAVSLAAWLGSWPLTAHYFHLFSPVTLPANLIIVHLSSAALASAMGSLICAGWFPWATELFNHSAWFWMWLMLKLSQAASGLPGAFFYMSPISTADFVIYYGMLFAGLSGFAFARRGRVWTAAGMACALTLYPCRWHVARGTATLTVLPLNGGSAVYCDAPGRRNDLLVDCGNAASLEFVVNPFLRAHGINVLPCLALTHGDLRHVGGTEQLCALMPVREIAASAVRFRSPTYRRIIENLQAQPARRRVVNRGDRLGLWTALHPEPDDHFPQADDNALVLQGEFAGTRILLLSDLGRPGQNALLERSRDLRADIVVAGLPERGEPLCDQLLDAIQPQLIVVVDSEFPATKRARPRLRARLQQRGVPVIYTRSAGAVKIRARRNRWTATAMDGTRLRGGTAAQHQPPPVNGLVTEYTKAARDVTATTAPKRRFGTPRRWAKTEMPP